MNDLFKHPMWTNKLARSALFCILAYVPLSIVGTIFPSWGLVWAFIAIMLGIAAFVLAQVAIQPRNIFHKLLDDLLADIHRQP